MRIAMVSEHASPLAVVGGVDAGGQNVHVEALSRALARAGHEVTVYTRRDSADLPAQIRTADGVLVTHLDAGPATPLPKDDLLPLIGKFGSALAAQLAAAPPDLVHAHFWMSGLAALAATRELDVPVVQTFHALGVTKQRFQGQQDTSPPTRIRFERALAHDAARIIALSSDEVGELLAMGATRDRIAVVPSGVDVEQFRPDGPVAERGERPRVLCVGRLVPRKGFDTVIRALAAVPEAELIIAGGPVADRMTTDPEAARLMRLAERFGVADRVRLAGAVSRADMPVLMRSADVVVCTPWYEPFGIVPLEAMACGVPVIAGATGGFLDTVVDGATGTLVPSRRPDRLAAAMRQLLAEPFWREAYGTAGVDRARSRYSWDRIAAGTLAVYEDVLGRVEPAADALETTPA
ncbi:MAG TPA: glycosyltransferase [Mycobacteriales bacterium]|jgi:glycosyltransferase involved in cell wall biosynthesis|nr:glycosyltransferase [Mycobacteriales bacterium]